MPASCFIGAPCSSWTGSIHRRLLAKFASSSTVVRARCVPTLLVLFTPVAVRAVTGGSPIAIGCGAYPTDAGGNVKRVDLVGPVRHPCACFVPLSYLLTACFVLCAPRAMCSSTVIASGFLSFVHDVGLACVYYQVRCCKAAPTAAKNLWDKSTSAAGGGGTAVAMIEAAKRTKAAEAKAAAAARRAEEARAAAAHAARVARAEAAEEYELGFRPGPMPMAFHHDDAGIELGTMNPMVQAAHGGPVRGPYTHGMAPPHGTAPPHGMVQPPHGVAPSPHGMAPVGHTGVRRVSLPSTMPDGSQRFDVVSPLHAVSEWGNRTTSVAINALEKAGDRQERRARAVRRLSSNAHSRAGRRPAPGVSLSPTGSAVVPAASAGTTASPPPPPAAAGPAPAPAPVPAPVPPPPSAAAAASAPAADDDNNSCAAGSAPSDPKPPPPPPGAAASE